MTDFANFLYELRKQKNMTQNELAEKLGVTNKAVSKWETGEAMPETSLLIPLSECLGVSVDELLRGERIAEKQQNTETAFKEDVSQKNNAEHEKKAKNSIHIESGKHIVDISHGHVTVNGKDYESYKPNIIDKISGGVCGAFVMVGIFVYLIIGILLDGWHPYWCIPASCALGCGIISCTFDMFNKEKRQFRRERGRNIFIGSLCGIIMLTSLIIFLCVSSILNMWYIMWISPAAGVVACGVIGSIGGIFEKKPEIANAEDEDDDDDDD